MNYNKVVVPLRREAEKAYNKKDVINYHGPYVDSSGETFYLP